MLAVNDPDAAAIFAEFALVNAADALLARDGYHVRGKTGAHRARFEYPLLPSVFSSGSQLMGAARSMRNAAAYEGGGQITPAQATQITDFAEEAVRAIDALLP